MLTEISSLRDWIGGTFLLASIMVWYANFKRRTNQLVEKDDLAQVKKGKYEQRRLISINIIKQ